MNYKRGLSGRLSIFSHCFFIFRFVQNLVASGSFEADRSQGGTFPKYKSGVGKGKNGPHGKQFGKFSKTFETFTSTQLNVSGVHCLL